MDQTITLTIKSKHIKKKLYAKNSCLPNCVTFEEREIYISEKKEKMERKLW